MLPSAPRLLALAALSLIWCTIPAWAQPANNDRGDATVIESLPYTDSLSTVDATPEANDPDCAGNGATIWYTFTPDADVSVAANTFGSDYDTTLSVYVNDPEGDLTQIACNDDFNSLQSLVVWNATAGTTYQIMVGSYASGDGGNLTFTLEESLPPLVLEVGLDGKSSVIPKTGVVTVRGTVLCNEPVTVEFISGQLRQRKGRLLISADWGVGGVECVPPSTAWSAEAISGNGFFGGGPATVHFVSAFACGSQSCDDVFIEGPIAIKLSGKKR